jgi:hypothetical protein
MLSVLFWFLSKLSKKYTHTVTFKTEYINLTEDKILQNKLDETISVTIEAFGYNLLGYNLKSPKLKIDLNSIQYKKGNSYYYLPNQQLTALQNQMSSNVKIIRVSPDTINFEFGILKSKKIIIKPDVKINFKPGFNLSEPLIISPQTITVTAPDKQLDSIQFIYTEKFIIDDVSENFTKKLKLLLPKQSSNLKFSDDDVKVNAKVEKFTEGKINLYYTIVNVPKDINIDTFIKSVNLTYKVSLNNFNKVNQNDFIIECDYLVAKKNGLNYFLPTIKKKPKSVSDIKIEPNKIEFLIRK